MIGRVTVERAGPVVRLVIDHAERHNALSEAMRDSLAEEMGRADADPEVRCIVLTGAGEKAFAAGGDIRELASRTLEEQRRVMTNGSVFGAVRRVRTPIVAAINGVCLGGGLELALACDLRIAARHAKFGQPEVAIGLIPGGGATQMLPRIVGLGAALGLVLTGEAIGAEEAIRIGLIHEMVDEYQLQDRAMAVASTIASRAPLAVQAAKEATRAALDLPLEEGRQLEVALFERCFESEDRREGVQAFLAKRAPRFQGR
jgi:enoyl-CoA hydratase